MDGDGVPGGFRGNPGRLDSEVVSNTGAQNGRKALLLLTVDTESSMVGVRPLPPEVMVYGRMGGGVWGIQRIMDCCDERGFKATFFVSTLEELYHGEEHVRQMCATVLERGHDAQLHLHPNWWREDFARKRLTDYSFEEQLEVIGLAKDAYRRACGADPVAHRAGGLLVNGETLRVLHAHGIGVDASVAAGYHAYDLGDGVAEPTVPRRLAGVVEVPVTTFAQMRLGCWAPRRNFDINADSLSELEFVVDRAASEGVTAVTLLMHSFSFVGRNREGTEFWPAEGELRKFERFLDHVASRDGVEVVTFRELAERLASDSGLVSGPDFSPMAGVLRTYRRSWERFESGWKSKAFALGLPVAVAGLAALVIGALWWLAW